MRSHQLAAAVALFSCAILTASCLQGPEAQQQTDATERVQRSNGPEPIGEAQQEVESRRFVPAEFPFVVDRKDDRKGKAGGWQVAHNTSCFGVIINDVTVYEWQCNLEVGMPLRTEKRGRVPSTQAAEMSAAIGNDVMFPLLTSRVSWQGAGALFCIKLQEGMKAMFRVRHSWLGARVERR